MARAKFVVLEGIGGSGKTIQLRRAKKYLEFRGLPVVVTREPGGIPEAETIRELVFDLKRENIINADHQMALFFAARKLWMESQVIPSLKKGINVLSDRTYVSTAAYQGYGEGGKLSTIKKMSDVVLGDYKPDKIILIDIGAEISVERNHKAKGNDPYDDMDMRYFRRVVRGYREMAKKRWGGVSWSTIDGEKSVDKVESDIRVVLNRVLGIK